MKRILNLCLFFVCLSPLSTNAQDFAVTAEMQSCSVDSDCGLISNNCQKNCGFIPVNKAAISPLSKAYEITCRSAMTPTQTCGGTAITTRCVNNLCSVDAGNQSTQAQAPVSEPKAKIIPPKAPVAPTAPTEPKTEYKTGAYNNSEPAAQNKVQGDYSKVNDRQGNFTAYSLPKADVKDGTVGQIITKIYVPANAPVSGEQYSVIETKEVKPIVPAPTQPTVQKPSVTSVKPTKVPEKPVTSLPSVPPVSAPALAPAPAQPKEKTQAQVDKSEEQKPLADMPQMTPSRPYQQKQPSAPVISPENTKEPNETANQPKDEQQVPSRPDGSKPTQNQPTSDMPETGIEPQSGSPQTLYKRDDTGPYKMSDLPDVSEVSNKESANKPSALSAAPKQFTIKPSKNYNE